MKWKCNGNVIEMQWKCNRNVMHKVLESSRNARMQCRNKVGMRTEVPVRIPAAFQHCVHAFLLRSSTFLTAQNTEFDILRCMQRVLESS